MPTPMVTPENFQKFLAFARQKGVNLNDPDALGLAMQTWYYGGYDSDMHKKDFVPPRQATGWVYDNGPFTMHDNELYSMVIRGGSPLLQWLPTAPMTTRTERVQHLSWVAPAGWTGQDYAAYLSGLVIGVCEYGPPPDWNGCEYRVGYGEMSFRSDSLHRFDFADFRESPRTPIYTVRGTPGLPMSTDADWAIAQTAIILEQHQNWNIMFGVEGGNLQFDGIDQIVTPGYVDAHIVGAGSCRYVDPVVVDGTTITNCEDLLEVIKGVVRKIRTRAFLRSWMIDTGDMILLMPLAFWAYMADCIACGGPTGCGVVPGGMTYRDWREERARATSGYFGFGFVEVDGQPVPVIPDAGLGVNGGAPGAWTVTGDIFVLTRRVGGMTILEQQYFNWSSVALPDDSWTTQGGLVRVGWVDENKKCYYYFSEMAGRLVTRMQPFQGRISSITVQTTLSDEAESGLYGDSFYPLLDGKGALVPL